MIPELQVKGVAQSLLPYLDTLTTVSLAKEYEASESSMNLPFDEDIVRHVHDAVEQKKSDALRYIIVIGIGGSNLGTKAIYDALLGNFDRMEAQRFPKMIFLDTNDAKFLSRMKVFLEEMIESPRQILLNVVSKSGDTIETVINFEIVLHILHKKFGDVVFERIVVTTDFQTKLWHAATGKGVTCLEIPRKVGGRFSVLSPVGLFPCELAGIDTSKMMEGARDMRNQCLNKNVLENPAALTASLLFIHAQQGMKIHDNFFFHPELESLGKWYRQLLAESIGKDTTGITPTVSIGSTDLHSMAQLYLAGPHDKFTTFVWARESDNDIVAPLDSLLIGIDGARGKTCSEIMYAILTGVKSTYSKIGLPFVEIIMSDLSEHGIGQFLQFKMIEIMMLGHLMDVNAFDQPAVELYKREVHLALT